MKRPKSQSPQSPQFPDAQAPDPKKTPSAPVSVSTVRTTPRDFINPIDYQHPYDSMARFARALSLRKGADARALNKVRPCTSSTL